MNKPLSLILPSPPRHADSPNGSQRHTVSPQVRGPSTSSHSELLPRLGRLAVDGYGYEPSATQLEAMLKTDPGSLKQVCVCVCVCVSRLPCPLTHGSLVPPMAPPCRS